MASPTPAKLQPLHNFSFTHLNWKNHRSGRSRLAGGETSSSSQSQSPSPSPATTWRESSSLRSHTHLPSPSPPHRYQSQSQTSPANGFRRPSSYLHKQSPMRDLEFEADQNYASQFIEKSGRRIITESSTKSIDNNNNNHKRKRSNKISIRIRENSNRNDAVSDEIHSSTPMNDSVPPPPVPAAGEDESSAKTWNLRPRRPPVNQKQSTGGLPKIGTSRLHEIKTSHETIINKQLPELNTYNNTYGMNMMKSKKQKFSIPLSRSEIEEDVLLLTGSKPSRRPKKRPRAIQKQLDNLFPGLWLDSITADSYKVSEASTKG